MEDDKRASVTGGTTRNLSTWYEGGVSEMSTTKELKLRRGRFPEGPSERVEEVHRSVFSGRVTPELTVGINFYVWLPVHVIEYGHKG